jgi:hypothetical protein
MPKPACCSRTLLVTAAFALAGCQTPAQTKDQVKAIEPQARAAAAERATTDLNCSAINTQVLNSDHGDLSDPYALKRVVYRVQATGCSLRATYSVACTTSGMCSAMSEGGVVERVKP